jgi:nucleotide-binding universal stress UspA family protein
MKRILIPTDFSDISKNSIIYGFHLAEKLHLQVHLLHVLELYKFAAGTSEAEIISTILPADNIQEMEASATESFKKIMEQIKKYLPASVPFEMNVISGHLVNEMISESSNEETALLILAVAGTQDLITRFTHSTISAIIEDSACPVMVVPSGFSYRDTSKVVLATDFNKADLEMLHKFITLFGLFNPEILVLHISPKQNDFKTELKFAGFKQLVQEKIAYSNVRFKLMNQKNIVQGIIDTLASENADLLLMLKEHESFFASLFETSRTEKIAHFLKTPMISYHQLDKTKSNN